MGLLVSNCQAPCQCGGQSGGGGWSGGITATGPNSWAGNGIFTNYLCLSGEWTQSASGASIQVHPYSPLIDSIDWQFQINLGQTIILNNTGVAIDVGGVCTIHLNLGLWVWDSARGVWYFNSNQPPGTGAAYALNSDTACTDDLGFLVDSFTTP